eukprot:scaffold157293_cov46-Prasinocladus_malaysianus.AAC.1
MAPPFPHRSRAKPGPAWQDQRKAVDYLPASLQEFRLNTSIGAGACDWEVPQHLRLLGSWKGVHAAQVSVDIDIWQLLKEEAVPVVGWPKRLATGDQVKVGIDDGWKTRCALAHRQVAEQHAIADMVTAILGDWSKCDAHVSDRACAFLSVLR